MRAVVTQKNTCGQELYVWVGFAAVLPTGVILLSSLAHDLLDVDVNQSVPALLPYLIIGTSSRP